MNLKTIVRASIIMLLCSLAGRWGSISAAEVSPRGQTSEELSFLVIGDWGMGTPGQRSAANGMAKVAGTHRPRFIVSAGDNFYPRGVQSVQDPLWSERFERIYDAPALQIPWYAALGNHDHGGSIQAQIDYSRESARWRMPAAYYAVSFKVSDATAAEFFILDSMQFLDSSLASKQLEWLEEKLRASTAQWLIVVGHHPIYTASRPYREPSLEMLRRLQPLLEKYRVVAYIAGHDHDLQHIRPKRQTVEYFISGAGGGTRPVGRYEDSVFGYSDTTGFMLGRITRDTFEITFFNDNGTELYRTTMTDKRAAQPVR